MILTKHARRRVNDSPYPKLSFKGSFAEGIEFLAEVQLMEGESQNEGIFWGMMEDGIGESKISGKISADRLEFIKEYLYVNCILYYSFEKLPREFQYKGTWESISQGENCLSGPNQCQCVVSWPKADD